MNKRNLFYIGLITFFSFLLSNTYAQKIVTGNLKDSFNKNIIGMNVRLVSGKDTLYSKSDEKGGFIFNNIRDNDFSLSIISLIYKSPFFRFSFQKDQTIMQLKSIVLRPVTTALKEVQIKGKVTPVIFKKDTIEYNALAYPVEKYARVKEILKHLPGIEIDNNGNLTFEGQSISKLRVNGKDFFSGNVTEFITQLPANIISKLQVINDYGDRANFTGIKNGVGEKMLNLVTNSNINSGTFGGVALNSGTDKRYGMNLNGNYWKDTKQISLNTSLNTASNESGITTANFLRLNYRNNIGEKIVFNGDFNYQQSHSKLSTSSSNETFNGFGTIYNNSSNLTEGNRSNYSLNSNIQYIPDESNFITASLSVQNSDVENIMTTSGIQSGVIHQMNYTNTNAISSVPIYNGSFSVSHQFKKRGRSISLDLIVNKNDNVNSQDISDKTGYISDSNALLKDSLFHRVINTDSKTLSSSLDMEYAEPIKDNMNLNMFYKFEKAKTNNTFFTDLVDLTGNKYRIDSLSNIYHTVFNTSTTGINYNYTKGKLSTKLNLALQYNLRDMTYDDRNYNISKSYFNFIPTVIFTYDFSKEKTFSFRYSANTLYPDFEKLLPIKDLRNVQISIIGNPYLSPAITHLVNFNFRVIHPNTNSILLLGLYGSATQNQIVANTVLVKDTLNSFKQENRYLNVNGTYNIGSSYNYTFPPLVIKAVKFNTSMIGGTSYSNGTIYTDNNKSFITKIIFTQQARLWVNTKNIGFDGVVDYSYNYNSYSINSSNIAPIQILQFKGSSWINILNSLNLSFDATKKINKGYQPSLIGNPLILNASIGQKLFKKYNGSVRITFTDLLNQVNNIQRNINGNSVVDTRTNFVTRYILLAFQIQIDRFNKK
ncbi:outer membrane beta-barrel protein [Mucilaginibacter arboris]|uniref:Outer membrane beta-barrel protein n=1 Tax=Mucilaginibacter arboris TaxID=2682090 RepID=A0A7K1SW52_9SPHI|nr:outer membrane beta-barrel protein [Mucilaginibacter arboris]MVN21290.1 outer membrane beta-barrel protein [Mucilaginibacter arboris]